MDEEQQLRLANRISEGLADVTRSEWMRWMQIAHDYGLVRAIELASKLGQDVTLRPGIKRSNQLIANTMRRYTRDLSDLKATEQDNVIGYISRILLVRTATNVQTTKKKLEYDEIRGI